MVHATISMPRPPCDDEFFHDDEPVRESACDLSRRDFLIGTAGTGAVLIAAPLLAQSAPEAAVATVPVTLTVNGRKHELRLDPRTSLLDALREQLDLTGTKKGCDQGACGACTVLIDGRRVNSCLTFAVMQDGKKITTVEGIAVDGALHPLQAAFIRNDGFQCGYCTPGQLCSAVALIAEGHTRSDEEIREWMSGNICRCGAYPGIVAAIREASRGTV